MPQPNEQKNSTNKNPNWVEVSTLAVLTLTLMVVGLYTREAQRQSELIQKNIEITSRPVMSAGFNGIQNPRSGEKLRSRILITNLGNSPTKIHIRSTVRYSLEKLESPPLNSTDLIQLAWPRIPIDIWIESTDAITEGQINDMRSSRGWIYAMADITYEGYRTAICTVVPIKGTPSNPNTFITPTDESHLCTDPKSNEVN